MELTYAEKSLLLEAVNAYWYESDMKLSRKDLGDIERMNWEVTNQKLKELLVKLRLEYNMF